MRIGNTEDGRLCKIKGGMDIVPATHITTSSSSNTMNIETIICGHVKVYNTLDSLDVKSTCCKVSSKEVPHRPVTKGLESIETLKLR